ncbi:MAG: hypothetical protein JNL60_13275 [Bacteroidia bacterium]|nr:hypothetical protein [Bacteroidia bacterium]
MEIAVQSTSDILKELKASKKFTEGFNVSIDGCKCERCSVSRYRHTSQPELMDPTHSYWDYLRYCISSVNINGLWMEFGVGMGSTIDFIADKAFGQTIIGFDSFEGLPEDWKMSDSLTYLKGHYALNGTIPPLKSGNIRLVKGNFNQTLPEFLQRNSQVCAFVHLDCDLYNSTLYVLNMLHQHGKIVKGTILLFDELYNYQYFEQHEFRAFQEFFAVSGLKYSWLAHTASPVVWNGNQAAIIIE